MSNIFNKVNEIASFITEEDLDEWIIPQLMDYYDSKINSLAMKAYGYAGQCSNVARQAFKQSSKDELKSAMMTFLFKAQHWKNNRDLNSYLLKTLNRLSDRKRWDSNDTAKKVNVPVCPGCKSMHRREWLKQDGGKMWRCEVCTSELVRLGDIIKDTDKQSLILKYQARMTLHKTFATHSRKGYKCEDCKGFIPESNNGKHGISCPYINCMFFGIVGNLEVMSHPVGLTGRIDLSLQTPLDNDGGIGEIQDTFIAQTINPDSRIEMEQSFSKEFKLLRSVINEQLASVERTNSAGTMLQKILMYEAFHNMMEKCPEDMVSYLVHRKQSTDLPIQSKIFQEYISLMQDSLPYTIKYAKGDHEVISLLDPKISLFEGKTEFNAVVRSDNTIPNNTTEVYIGGRSFHSYGPCYLGLILDIKDRRSGESIKSSMKEYSFVQINMNENIEPGTPVSVSHYFINSHYEIGAMVYLQRIRKKIVDKIYFKMYGTKREARA